MIEAYAGMLRRLDVTTLHVESKQHSNETVEGYSMMLFANIIWSQDNYGELLFYEDGDDLDIFGLAAPRFGRIVVWDSAIPYILRPPSITFVGGEYVIFARFHSDPQVIYENRQYFIDWMEDIKVNSAQQSLKLRKLRFRAPKSPNKVASNFFNTVNLLRKDLRFEHGDAPNLFLATGVILPRYAPAAEYCI